MKTLLIALALAQVPSPEPSKGHVALSLSCAGPAAVRVTIANDGDIATGVWLGALIGGCVSAPNRSFTRYPDDFRLKVLPDYLRASLTGRTLTDQDAFTRMPLPELWTGWVLCYQSRGTRARST